MANCDVALMSPSSKRNARQQGSKPRAEASRNDAARADGTQGHATHRETATPDRVRANTRSAPRLDTVHADAERVVINRRAAIRVAAGHPWVYRSDIVSAHATPGSFVTVQDERGHTLGMALYSSSSQIAVRMFAPAGVKPETLPALLRQRLRDAITYRERFVRDTNAYRVLFSEADATPGLIVDHYNDVLTVQVLTQAMDREDLREALVGELVSHFSPAGIVERVDERIRQLEVLPPRQSGLLHGQKSATDFQMNGLRFRFDALAGQKTGAFLDQRENYAAAATYARGEALDVFCYQGGFALHLTRVCDRVTGVDSSRAALEMAEQNESLNREQWPGREIEWMEANAFDLLRDYADAGRK